jgi:potassium inwardly-rectifying channel subfamily J
MTIIRKETTEEGEIIPHQQSELDCGTHLDGSNASVSIIWPVTVSHKINESSPFYALKPSNVFLLSKMILNQVMFSCYLK